MGNYSTFFSDETPISDYSTDENNVVKKPIVKKPIKINVKPNKLSIIEEEEKQKDGNVRKKRRSPKNLGNKKRSKRWG